MELALHARWAALGGSDRARRGACADVLGEGRSTTLSRLRSFLSSRRAEEEAEATDAKAASAEGEAEAAEGASGEASDAAAADGAEAEADAAAPLPKPATTQYRPTKATRSPTPPPKVTGAPLRDTALCTLLRHVADGPSPFFCISPILDNISSSARFVDRVCFVRILTL